MQEVQQAPAPAPENSSSMIAPAADGLGGPVPPDRPEPGDPAAAEAAADGPPAVPRRRVNEWWKRRQDERAAARRRRAQTLADRSGWAIAGVVALAVLVLSIVGVGLSVSLGPLRDTAMAAHIDPTAASLWWIGVDGLVVVAIIAGVVLRHDPWARFYALLVVAFFTGASGLLQFLHGLGLTAPDQAGGGDPRLPWQVVALIATLVIGTIFCATHLFIYVLRHLFPRALADQAEQVPDRAAEPSSTTPEKINDESDSEDGPPDTERSEEQPSPPPTPEPDPLVIAALVYGACLDADVKLSRKRLAEIARISERQAGHIRTDVEIEREEAEAERQAATLREAMRRISVDTGSDRALVNGSPSGGDRAVQEGRT
jgi:hypothetical protein